MDFLPLDFIYTYINTGLEENTAFRICEGFFFFSILLPKITLAVCVKRGTQETLHIASGIPNLAISYSENVTGES